MDILSVVLLQIGLTTGLIILRIPVEKHVLQVAVNVWISMADEDGEFLIHMGSRTGYQCSAVNGNFELSGIFHFSLLRYENRIGKLSNTTLGKRSGGENESLASLYGCLNTFDNDLALAFAQNALHTA